MPPRKERELFVKWKYMSYWHCEWVNEMVIEVWYPQSLRNYWRKMDPEVSGIESMLFFSISSNSSYFV